MIKAFLFDYDGVITSGVNVALPAQRLAENLGISADEASRIIMSTWDNYSMGRLSIDEIWDNIENQLGQKVTAEKRDIWHTWEELTPIPFMIEFVNELKSKGYPVGVVSNVFQETASIIRQNGGYGIFDFTILSYEVGARKPEPEIYEYAMKKLTGIAKNEVIFLDDRQQCIDAAIEFGLHAIHVTNHQNAIKEAYSLIEREQRA